MVDPPRLRLTSGANSVSGPAIATPPPRGPPPHHPAPARRPLDVWALAVGAALLLADALDSPVGAGARDEAQAVAPGPVAVPGSAVAAGTGSAARAGARPPPPDGVADLPDPPGEPSERAGQPGPRSAAPGRARLGPPAARRAGGRHARLPLRPPRAPGDLAARAGLAMLDGADGEGLARGQRGWPRSPPSTLTTSSWRSTRAGSRSNAGAPAAERAARTVDLGADTRLGRTAAALLAELGPKRRLTRKNAENHRLRVLALADAQGAPVIMPPFLARITI